MSNTLTEQLEQFRKQIESRNAQDFLADLILHFSGHLGSFLVSKQIEADHANGECRCETGHDDLDAELIED